MTDLTISRPRYEIASEGLHPATLAIIDHTDLGDIDYCDDFDDFHRAVDDEDRATAGDHECVYFGFDLQDESDWDGRPKRVFRVCNFELTSKSSLTSVVVSMLGRTLTEQEWRGFDLMQLVGRSVLLMVRHRENQAGQRYVTADTIISIEQEALAVPIDVDVDLPI